MNELDLNIGAQVHCRDGKAGKLAKVVVDPESYQVTDLIVEEGFLLKRARVFPISTVEDTGENGIYLSITSHDLDDYSEYREMEYERPVSGWEHPKYKIDNVAFPGYSIENPPVPMVKEKVREGISSELEVVRQGTAVNNVEGTIGKLAHVVTDSETNEITHLVMKRGAVFPDQIDIPISLVKRVDEDGILVTVTDEELDEYIPA